MAVVREQDLDTDQISRYQLTMVRILHIDNVSFPTECSVS